MKAACRIRPQSRGKITGLQLAGVRRFRGIWTRGDSVKLVKPCNGPSAKPGLDHLSRITSGYGRDVVLFE